MKYLAIILLFISCTSNVKIKRIIDGDTIVTVTRERIRLAEIDAPESQQEYGQHAKQFLSNLILGKTIQIRRKGKDKYHRTIAELYYNGIWINKMMVDSGQAWAYIKYSSLYPDEIIARNKRLGLWAYPYEAPFLYRKHIKIKSWKRNIQ